MSNLIDSLKRLERAGAENSRTTEKLREAAVEVAIKIAVTVAPHDRTRVELPRGYEICAWEDEAGAAFGYLRPAESSDYFEAGATPSLASAQIFAADIASGLLDEIAAFLEERAAQNEQATATLEAAKV